MFFYPSQFLIRFEKFIFGNFTGIFSWELHWVCFAKTKSSFIRFECMVEINCSDCWVFEQVAQSEQPVWPKSINYKNLKTGWAVRTAKRSNNEQSIFEMTDMFQNDRFFEHLFGKIVELERFKLGSSRWNSEDRILKARFVSLKVPLKLESDW